MAGNRDVARGGQIYRDQPKPSSAGRLRSFDQHQRQRLRLFGAESAHRLSALQDEERAEIEEGGDGLHRAGEMTTKAASADTVLLTV
jgi:hypothetical protein